MFGKGSSQKDAPTVHGLGELAREIGLLHGLVPVGLGRLAAPVGRFVGLQDAQEILHHGTIDEGLVVGTEEPWRGGNQMFPRGFGHCVAPIAQLDEPHGTEECDQHVGRPRVELVPSAESFHVGRYCGQCREKVHSDQCENEQVLGVQAIPIAVEGRGIGGGCGGQGMAHGSWQVRVSGWERC